VRNSIVAPSSVGRPARIASARSWLTSPDGSGENAAKSGSAWVKLCSTGPDALCATTTAVSSAITTVLDRLERAGVIERTADPADRRKVIVTPTHRHEEARAAVFAELGERFGAVLGDYDDRQLELMTEFLRRLNAVSYALTRSLPGRADADR
jgi:hypothetical protein